MIDVARKYSSIEKELKYRLSVDEYRRLLRVLKPQIVRQSHLQTYYLDDPALRLRKRRCGLRVRITDGAKAAVTLKFPARGRGSRHKAYKRKHEFEKGIRFPTARKIIAGEVPITGLGSLPLQILRRMFPDSVLEGVGPLGCLTTYRTLARFESLDFELDRCLLYDKRFYELEIETEEPDETDATVRTLFRAHGIRYSPSTESKLAKFLKAWKRKD